MDRRSFFKKITAVAAGAVVIPTIVKKLPFKPNAAQGFIWQPHRYGGEYLIIGRHDAFLHKTSETPEYPLGTLYRTANGNVYKYMQRIILC